MIRALSDIQPNLAFTESYTSTIHTFKAGVRKKHTHYLKLQLVCT